MADRLINYYYYLYSSNVVLRPTHVTHFNVQLPHFLHSCHYIKDQSGAQPKAHPLHSPHPHLIYSGSPAHPSPDNSLVWTNNHPAGHRRNLSANKHCIIQPPITNNLQLQQHNGGLWGRKCLSGNRPKAHGLQESNYFPRRFTKLEGA